jgi:hypothetical protein
VDVRGNVMSGASPAMLCPPRRCCGIDARQRGIGQIVGTITEDFPLMSAEKRVPAKLAKKQPVSDPLDWSQDEVGPCGIIDALVHFKNIGPVAFFDCLVTAALVLSDFWPDEPGIQQKNFHAR